jgi:hypothetical protein
VPFLFVTIVSVQILEYGAGMKKEISAKYRDDSDHFMIIFHRSTPDVALSNCCWSAYFYIFIALLSIINLYNFRIFNFYANSLTLKNTKGVLK